MWIIIGFHIESESGDLMTRIFKKLQQKFFYFLEQKNQVCGSGAFLTPGSGMGKY
jgi:hypothetical protein